MNSLLNKVNKLIKKLTSEEERNSMIVFAISSTGEWDDNKEEFIGEDNTPIEAYVVPSNLQEYFDKANSLQELRTLGERYNFIVYAFASSVSMEELWSDYE